MKLIQFIKPVKFMYKPLGENVQFRLKDITGIEDEIADKLIEKGFAETYAPKPR